MRLQFAQKAFIVDSERLLLVRKAATDPYHPLCWEVPGGQVQPGEDVDAHIRREVWEEVGISIVPGRPFHLWQWMLPTADGDQVQFFAVARLCAPTSFEISDAHRVAGDHLGEMRWVGLADIPDYPLIPDMVPVMRDFLAAWCTAGFSPPEVSDVRGRPGIATANLRH